MSAGARRLRAGVAGLLLVGAACRGGDFQGADRGARERRIEVEAAWIDAAQLPKMAESFVASGGEAVALPAGACRVELALPDAAPGERVALRCSVVGAPLDWTVAWRGATESSKCRVEPRAHRECLEWVALGEWPLGATTIVLEKGAASPAAQLDLLALMRGAPLPDEPRSAWRSADGRFEVRAAPGASLSDPEWTLKLLMGQAAAVESLLAARLERRVALIALPAAATAFDVSGGFQHGHALFLREDELHLPWRGYAHELFHVVEEERVLGLPWSWSEGLACALALDVADATVAGIEGPKRQRDALARLRREGDAFHRPGDPPDNAVLPLAEPPDDPDRCAAGYAWATALVEEAARRGGRGFYARFLAAYEEEFARAGPGRGELIAAFPAAAECDRYARAALVTAAGAPLDDLFAACGLCTEIR